MGEGGNCLCCRSLLPVITDVCKLYMLLTCVYRYVSVVAAFFFFFFELLEGLFMVYLNIRLRVKLFLEIVSIFLRGADVDCLTCLARAFPVSLRPAIAWCYRWATPL